MIKFVVYLRKRKMKMKLNIFALLLASALLSGFAADAQVSGTVGLDRSHSKEFREALRLHDYGMYSRSRQSFDELSRKTGAADPEGYAVLNDVKLNVVSDGDFVDAGDEIIVTSVDGNRICVRRADA